MSYKVLLSLMVILGAGSSLNSAYSETLGHQPPTSVSYDEILLTLPASGLKRARLLVASPGGYRIIPMSRIAGDKFFKAAVTFGELAILKYQFQAETEEGKYIETSYFQLSEPVGQDLKEQFRYSQCKVSSSFRAGDAVTQRDS